MSSRQAGSGVRNDVSSCRQSDGSGVRNDVSSCRQSDGSGVRNDVSSCRRSDGVCVSVLFNWSCPVFRRRRGLSEEAVVLD
jgi:hypothetical protein